MLQEMNDTNVDSIVNGSRTFLVVFYTDKIANMPNIIKVFEEFDEQFKGKIDVYTCEIDKMTRTKEYFGMTTLPAMVMMKSGKAYANIAGPASQMVYQQKVKDGIMQIMSETKKEGYSSI